MALKKKDLKEISKRKTKRKKEFFSEREKSVVESEGDYLSGFEFSAVFIEDQNSHYWIRAIAVCGLGSCPDCLENICELTLG